MTGRSSNPKPSWFLSIHPQKTWAHCDFLPFFFLWVFGAELPREEWWKESLTAGSCLVITVLKIGVWEVPAAALLRLRFGDSGGSVSPCHCATAVPALCTCFLSSQKPALGFHQDLLQSPGSVDGAAATLHANTVWEEH